MPDPILNLEEGSASATAILNNLAARLPGTTAAQLAAEAARNLAQTAATTATTQAGIATTQAGLATTNGSAQVALATAQVTLATTAKTAAESARDAALIQSGVYTTEALGRAAVADGVAFKVQGSGNVAAFEYRRIDSATSVLIAMYPTATAALTAGGNLDFNYPRSGYEYLLLRGTRILDAVTSVQWGRFIYRLVSLEFLSEQRVTAEATGRNPWVFRVGSTARVLIGIKRLPNGTQEVHLNGAAVVINGAPFTGSPIVDPLTTQLTLLGDSMTTASLGYGGELATLMPTRTILNLGVGGQESGSIAARMGMEVTCSVAGNQIPASGGVVCSAFTNTWDPLDRLWNYCIRARLYGVAGTLSRDAGTITTFTRTTAGVAVTVPPACPLVVTSTHVAGTNAAAGVSLEDLRKTTVIIGIGRNDEADSDYALPQVTEPIRLLYRLLRNQFDRVLVLGPTNGEYLLTAARSAVGTAANDTISAGWLANHREITSALAAEYGPDFLSWQAMAQEAGYSNDFTISGTVYPVINLALQPDGIHATTGPQKQVFATAVKNFLDAKGW